MIFSKFARKAPLARMYAAVRAPVKARVGKPVKNVLVEDQCYGHHPNPEMWKKICLFVCVPALLASGANVFMCEMEHHKHFKQPEYVPYEYLNIKTRPFPWGDGQHTLFHNGKYNALPDGYTCPEGSGVHHSH